MQSHLADGEDWDDDEWNEPADKFDGEAHESDGEEEPTISCPYCKRLIHEDAPRCPYCENYLSEEDSTAHKPWWIIFGVLVCLIVVYYWIKG